MVKVRSIREICEEIIDEHRISTMQELVRLPSQFMVHINQEPDVFDTHVGTMDQEIRDHYKKYLNKIKYTGLKTYLNSALANDFPEVERKELLPASCREFALVSANLASVLLGREVYVIGRVNPKYAKLKQLTKRKHFLNAYENLDGAFIFFDSSVYKNIRTGKKWAAPPRDFNPADIDFKKYMQWDKWTQNDRVITPKQINTDYKDYTKIISL